MQRRGAFERVVYVCLHALLFAAVFYVFSTIQFSTSGLLDPDGYYHSKVAALLAVSWGLPIEFPWLPKTVLSTTRYVDHHYLFHVALAPFAAHDLQFGTKWGIVLFSTLVAATFYCALPPSSQFRRLQYFLLFFAASPAFLYRISMVRAQSLSLVVLLLVCHACIQMRWRRAAALSFIYVWLYNAFPLVSMVLIGCGVIAILMQDKLPIRGIVTVAVGLVAGMVINPYFPRNIAFLFHHLIDKFKPGGFAVRVGNEWYPYSAAAFMQHASVALVLLAVSVAVLVPLLGVANKEALKGSTICSANEEKVFLRSALLYLFLAVVFFTMFLKSRRFIELFPPFAILSFAWSIECYLRTSTVTRPRLDTTRVGAFALWVIPLLLGVLAYSSIQSASAQVKTSPRYGRFQAAGNWLRLNAEPGSLVVNADWDDFPRLFHFNSANTYFAGLDPYFSYVQDPQLFLAWREFGRGNFRGDVAELVRDRIGGRYVFLDDRHAKLGSQLAVDPRFTKVFSSNDSTIFEVSKDIR